MKYSIVTIGLLLLLSTVSISAQTPEEKGLAIAKEADLRDAGFGDYTADMLMVLRNRHGQESKRKIRLEVLEVSDDGDKSLIVFDNPRDVKGTAFLNFTHKADDDDQWLYLPALKRVKRISSSNKSGSFMGSEFAYEDFSSQEIEKYTYKWIRGEIIDDLDCYVVEFVPVDNKSGYSRQLVWIDKAEYRTLKVEFYDRKSSLLKILVINGYQQYLGRYWRAERLNMVNHQNGKSTELIWSDYQFQNGLNESNFSQASLKRAR